jgi:hypothetical protein
MVAVRKTVKVTQESTVEELLADADESPLILDKNGVRYHLSREDPKTDIWADYDPERARQVLDDVAGIFRDVDVDRWIDEIYEAREQGTRPIDRP